MKDFLGFYAERLPYCWLGLALFLAGMVIYFVILSGEKKENIACKVRRAILSRVCFGVLSLSLLLIIADTVFGVPIYIFRNGLRSTETKPVCGSQLLGIIVEECQGQQSATPAFRIVAE